MKRAIDKLRTCIREQRYSLSIHANKEMSDDDLIAADLKNAILTGRIAKRLTKDPRGIRYELLVKLATVGRSLLFVNIQPDWLRIITIYTLEHEEP